MPRFGRNDASIQRATRRDAVTMVANRVGVQVPKQFTYALQSLLSWKGIPGEPGRLSWFAFSCVGGRDLTNGR
jgi:hypothetical protein